MISLELCALLPDALGMIARGLAPQRVERDSS